MLSYARQFRRFSPPALQALPPPPLFALLERYTLLTPTSSAADRPPIMALYPKRTHPYEELLDRLNSTATLAFPRPRKHTLYAAAPHPDMDCPQFTLIRQWIRIPTTMQTPVRIVTVLETAGHPADQPWRDYWFAINMSPPPAEIWGAEPPATLYQDKVGQLLYKNMQNGLT
jgi:hypothetical protein